MLGPPRAAGSAISDLLGSLLRRGKGSKSKAGGGGAGAGSGGGADAEGGGGKWGVLRRHQAALSDTTLH